MPPSVSLVVRLVISPECRDIKKLLANKGNATMVMTDYHELCSTLEKIVPTHVAVAYLGHGWDEYLNVKALEEIVVSPTLGSYPYALRDLLKAADQHDFVVYFQRDLHAKLFIGNEACLIGSSNLSRNGFSGGLREAGVHLQDADAVQQARAVFETFKASSVTDREQQRTMVNELVEMWQQARRQGLLPNEDGDRPKGTILDWKPGEERVWLAWVDAEEEPILNEARIRQSLPEIGHHQPADYFELYTTLVEDDDVRKGDWLIVWVAKADGTPHLGRSLYWLRVDTLVRHGAVDCDESYTQLAATLPSSGRVTPPFEIENDAKAQRLIKQLLASRSYPELLWSEDRGPWRFKDAVEDNQRFLMDLQQAYLD